MKWFRVEMSVAMDDDALTPEGVEFTLRDTFMSHTSSVLLSTFHNIDEETD